MAFCISPAGFRFFAVVLCLGRQNATTITSLHRPCRKQHFEALGVTRKGSSFAGRRGRPLVYLDT